MNIILITKEDIITDKKVRLAGRRAEHVIDVLKPEIGESLKIGIINGMIGKGKIIAKDDNSVEIEVYDLSENPPEAIAATLILAMQRPKTLRKVIQSATAMGVKKFYIIESWKVEKSYWNSPLLKTEKLEEQAILGLEQAGDTILPEFIIKRRFKPFVEDELPGILGGAEGLIAHPYVDEKFPVDIQKEVVITVGPEGGFTEYEVDKMKESGMKPVSLGKRILRSEFAVTAILAKLF
jgi:16S rRNA (uracil1498-N3)-methyltransferase